MTTERPTAAPRRRRTIAPLALAGLAVAVLGVGCSSTSTTSTASGSSSTTASTAAGTPGTSAGGPGTTAAPPSADLASIPVFEVAVGEDGATYSFETDDTVPAGLVMFDLKNNGKKPHQVNVARPKPNATIEAIDAALAGPNPTLALALAEFVGASNTVDPGGEQRTVVQLEPGTYYLLCFVPDEDGKDHLQHGMIKKITVTGSGTTAGTTPGSTPGTAVAKTAVPAEQAAEMKAATVGEIKMKDMAIALPEPFTGQGWYKVTNDGPQPHETTILKLASGKTSKDVVDFLSSETPSGPPPFSEVGGFGGLDKGNVGWVELDLAKGDYVALCFIPNTIPDPAGPPGPPDLKPHFAKGMTTPFTIS